MRIYACSALRLVVGVWRMKTNLLPLREIYIMLKLPSINENIAAIQRFREMAEAHGAIDLMRPYTVLLRPNALVDSLAQRLSVSTKYAPLEGSPELREAIAKRLSDRYFRKINPDTEITITAGATQALFCAVAASVGEGDEVIVFEPSHPTYAEVIAISGARTVYMPLRPDFTVDWVEVQKVINSRTKLIVVCSPHQASGVAFCDDDWEMLQKLISGTKIRVVSDEVIGEMAYPACVPASIGFYPRLSESAFVIGSLSKALCVAGWKIGYCVAPEGLTAPLRRTLSAIANSINHPMQLAFAAYMQQAPSTVLFPYADVLAEHRQMALDALIGSCFEPVVPHYGYNMVLDYSAHSSMPDVDLAERLIVEHNVAVMPMSVYYHDKQQRQQVYINLGVHRNDLLEALQRLRNIKL